MMEKTGRRMALAVAGMVLLGMVSAGIVLGRGGARAGREYIEGNGGSVQGTRSGGEQGEALQEDGSGRKTQMQARGAEPEKRDAGPGRADAESAGAEPGRTNAKPAEAESGRTNAKPAEAEPGRANAKSAGAEPGRIGSAEAEMAESEPGRTGTVEAKPGRRGEIVLLFAGDVYVSNHVLGAYDKAGGIGGVLDEGIREEIEAADLFMVNQEFPFTERGTAAADKQFTFRVPKSRMRLMQEMGVDIVTLANNHILDFGDVGLLDSCEALDEAGIRYVGGGADINRAGRLETVAVGEKLIGFLGMSRVYMDGSWAAGESHPGVFSTYDPALPLKAIREAKEACDFLVVYVHWGVERKEEPEDYQKALGRAYIDAGADLVVGSHPHVLQPVEEYQGKTIVYSLGNFVFGSSIPNTALLKVVWGDEGTDVSMIPCTSSGGYTRMSR